MAPPSISSLRENSLALPKGWDWKNPDYDAVTRMRMRKLDFLRSDPKALLLAKAYYRDEHYVEFIRDWGMMRDPRRAASGGTTVFPFIPFPRQVELFHWIHRLVKLPVSGGMGRGNVDKTRDCGFSWCCVAYACWRFIFFENNDIGFGSSLERNVYDLGNPKSLFYKINAFLSLLPDEFKPVGWESKCISKGTSAGKAVNPENGSTITGDCGDDIGRGGRTLVYFVDEHARIERPLLAEAALSENTNTQINGSTHRGPGSLFFRQCQSLKMLAPERLFEFDWNQDPRKDQEWYDRKKNDPMTDPVVFAEEVDRDPSASISDGFIDLELITDAEKNTNAIPHGPYIISVDVADMGNDESIINTRRGDVNYKQIKLRKKEADQVAAIVERHCKKLLEMRVAPIGAIIFEKGGPGYGFYVAMKSGPFKSLLRPISPSAKLTSREFYNERARFWGYFKEWLEEGNKSIEPDRDMRLHGASIRYTYKSGPDGSKRLLMEDKKDYKARMSADPKNKASGPSPDEPDAAAMSHAPVKLAKFTFENLQEALNEDIGFLTKHKGWGALDRRAGY